MFKKFEEKVGWRKRGKSHADHPYPARRGHFPNLYSITSRVHQASPVIAIVLRAETCGL